MKLKDKPYESIDLTGKYGLTGNYGFVVKVTEKDRTCFKCSLVSVCVTLFLVVLFSWVA